MKNHIYLAPEVVEHGSFVPRTLGESLLSAETSGGAGGKVTSSETAKTNNSIAD